MYEVPALVMARRARTTYIDLRDTDDYFRACGTPHLPSDEFYLQDTLKLWL
jgi:hypothetical protein